MTEQFKRIIVTFDKAVSPDNLYGNKTIMGEFMKCVSPGGLGWESDEGQPVSWSGETYLDPAEIQERLQTWWRAYALDCVVHYHGTVPYRTTNDPAHKFSIDPA